MSSSTEAAPTGTTTRIAGIVLKWILTAKQLNYERIEPMIREAAAGGARLVVTTECFLDGYAVRDKSIPIDEYHALAEPVPEGQYFQRLARLAAETKIYLAAGLHTVDGDVHYNSAVLIDPRGELVGIYHKNIIGHEVDRHVPGTETPVFDSHYGTLGMMICADRATPEVSSALRAAGADLLICLSGGSWGPEANDSALQKRSRETGRYIVFVHPTEFLVTDPDGSVVDVQLFGDLSEGGAALAIEESEIGTARDRNEVCYVDLPGFRADRDSFASTVGLT